MNSRRKFLKLSTLFGAGGLVTACSDTFNVKTNELKPRKFDHLPNMMDGIAAIIVDEHNERIALAQELMS